MSMYIKVPFFAKRLLLSIRRSRYARCALNQEAHHYLVVSSILTENYIR